MEWWVVSIGKRSLACTVFTKLVKYGTMVLYNAKVYSPLFTTTFLIRKVGNFHKSFIHDPSHRCTWKILPVGGIHKYSIQSDYARKSTACSECCMDFFPLNVEFWKPYHQHVLYWEAKVTSFSPYTQPSFYDARWFCGFFCNGDCGTDAASIKLQNHLCGFAWLCHLISG